MDFRSVDFQSIHLSLDSAALNLASPKSRVNQQMKPVSRNGVSSIPHTWKVSDLSSQLIWGLVWSLRRLGQPRGFSIVRSHPGRCLHAIENFTDTGKQSILPEDLWRL